MLCNILQQYSLYSFFGGILKTSCVTPFIAICTSRLILLPYSASHNSTIIADNIADNCRKDGISVHEAWVNSGVPFLRVPSGKPMMPPADRIHPNPGQCSNKIRSVAYAKEKIADKFMKFAGHLVMVVLIKGCGKNFISEQ